MRFENHFDVGAPIDTVWETLLDVERVAPTVPGAQVLDRVSDDAYNVAIRVKVGPMSMTYSGMVEITERDPAAHRAVLKARACSSCPTVSQRPTSSRSPIVTGHPSNSSAWQRACRRTSSLPAVSPREVVACWYRR